MSLKSKHYKELCEINAKRPSVTPPRNSNKRFNVDRDDEKVQKVDSVLYNDIGAKDQKSDFDYRS